MKRETVIISDFKNAVKEKDALSVNGSSTTWRVCDYETKDISGSFLIAYEKSLPKPVSVDPGLSGWYKIYVSMTNSHGVRGGINLQLTDDEFSQRMWTGNLQHYTHWIQDEWVAEMLWKCADMTGQSVSISKIDNGITYRSNLFWLRFEPMTEEEVKTYRNQHSCKTMLAHMDPDFHNLDAPKEPRDYCQPFYNMKDSNVGIVCEEVMNDLVDLESVDDKNVFWQTEFDERRFRYFKEFAQNRDVIYPIQIQYAHEKGMQLFASFRMALSSFSYPFDKVFFKIPFVDEHPEFRGQARDGSMCEFLSYAYKEVQDYVIDNLLQYARYGFDGVHLLFTRGMCVYFDEPIIRRFEEKYGKETDYRRIPDSDPRLYEIRGDVMFEFFKRLRNALDEYANANGKESLKIYITASLSVRENLQEGLDVERLASEQLIDGVIQSNARYIERAYDVLAEDGLIDLEKYCKKAENNYVMVRCGGNNEDLMAEGVGEYSRIADTYGIELYSEVPWENTKRPEEYVKAAKQIYVAGGHRLAMWDCYPGRVVCLPEWNATGYLGDPESVMSMSEDPTAYRTVHRILSVDGKDMRYYHPCWRG